MLWMSPAATHKDLGGPNPPECLWEAKISNEPAEFEKFAQPMRASRMGYFLTPKSC